MEEKNTSGPKKKKKIECFFSFMMKDLKVSGNKQQNQALFLHDAISLQKDATKLLHLCHHVRFSPSLMNLTYQEYLVNSVSAQDCTHISLFPPRRFSSLLSLSLVFFLTSCFRPQCPTASPNSQ